MTRCPQSRTCRSPRSSPPVDIHCFTIPGHEIDGQGKVLIPSRPEAYNGQWKRWLDLWDLVT